MASDSAASADQHQTPLSNDEPVSLNTTMQHSTRQTLKRAGTSYASVPPEGSLLTGKQEHYLKRELISQQTKYEIAELSSPTALQRFGAPFRSEKGEVPPEHSELPLLRYIFVHHVRNFPFLNQAKEKEFWQDKLQVFLESFANKNISSSEDRLEETKRKKLAVKAEKLVELMMVSGIPTASGYEERIQFSEIEVVERGANAKGLVANAPHGHEIQGWDVNVAGVRTKSVKRHVRYHQVAEFLIRVKESGKDDHYVGRTYDDFKIMHKRLRLELPGKVLPPLPRPNHSDSIATFEDDSDSASSVSTQEAFYQDASDAPFDSGNNNNSNLSVNNSATAGGLRSFLPFSGGGGSSGDTTPINGRNHSGKKSASSQQRTPRASADMGRIVLYRENQRVGLRAVLRNLLQNERIAHSGTMREFLLADQVVLNEEEKLDIERRKDMDERRIEEQKQFYEIARKRAAELDVHMEKFRREIVERNGLTKLYQEIRDKKTIAELKPEYKKFAEWLRIEVAATIYHLFIAEDNSPELFAQAKRIHSLVPYSVLKNIIRLTNPAMVMAQVLDLFMAQPFGTRSLLQRIFGMAIHDGINNIQKSIDILISQKIKDQILVDKIRMFAEADADIKEEIKFQADDEQVDILVAIFRSEHFEPELELEQVETVFNAYVAWTNAVENIDQEMREGAELYAHLKQLFKLYMRQRDKAMMLEMIEEPTTLKLFRDLFQIFYEPLVRVYKSANVYNSIIDFSNFVDDIIKVVEAAQRQDFLSADPNQTVQAFIDLCARHEDDFYKFVHEVHIHDNGLFVQLMGWLEGILAFLKQGPKGGKLDMNALFRDAVDEGVVAKEEAIAEINAIIKWQMARKRWHQDKTRQKMAAEGADEADGTIPGFGTFRSSDFGLNELDLEELGDETDDSSLRSLDSEDLLVEDLTAGVGGGASSSSDPLAAERERRARRSERLRRSAGEPVKPKVKALDELLPAFNVRLRRVLAT